MDMRAIDRMRIVAWACLLAGISLVVWQTASGNSSDMLFNIGVMAMVTGSVLRVYGEIPLWQSSSGCVA